MNEHPIEGMLGVSMEKIREMVDVNTIIGDPIVSPDGATTVIPVSKVGFGFGSGGTDIASKSDKNLFGGGAGAGVTIKPLAFLVINEGKVDLLQMDEAGSADKFLSSVPGTIEKLIDIFKNKDKKKKEGKDNKDKKAKHQKCD